MSGVILSMKGCVIMDSQIKYLQSDYEYLLKYMDETFLKTKPIREILLELNYVIIEHGFDDKMEFYNDEGKKLQEIYDNIYYMN